VDHATVQRWVAEYSPELMEQARKVMKSSADSWRMDETYIKVKGEWVYLYRAVDKFGNTIDFMLSQKRDKPAATRFITQAIGHAGLPEKIVIDKSGANTAGINAINEQLSEVGLLAFAITMIQSKYLNNIVEQDHRFIKKITRPMLGFKSFASAEATLAGIELHHIIRKGQLRLEESTSFEQFYALAG
jgi:putative transposase